LIRKCEDKDFEALYEIINDAAQAYQGIIPADRRHEPYMTKEEVRREIRQGVEFWGYEEEGLFPSQGSGGTYRTIAEEEIGEGKWMKTGLEKSFFACPLSCKRFPVL